MEPTKYNTYQLGYVFNQIQSEQYDWPPMLANPTILHLNLIHPNFITILSPNKMIGPPTIRLTQNYVPPLRTRNCSHQH